MNILFIDDELDVIDGMMDAVNFEAIGIENVYVSLNAKHAKSILEKQNIDIMVTDIEMPGESGIDLLKWVRDSDRDIVTMFCTSYANFNYAQKAVEMRSFGYFLKPISYADLQEHLRLAVEEVKKNRSLESYKTNKQYWLNLQKENQKSFWERIISGDIKNREATFKNCDDNQLSYTQDDKFAICIVSLSDNDELLSSWKKYAFKNISEEFFDEADFIIETILQIRDDTWCLFFKQNENFSESDFKETCQKMISIISKHLSVVVNCYYYVNSPLVDCHINFSRINDIFKDNFLGNNKLYSINDYRKKDSAYIPPNLREWELLFSAGQSEELLQAVNSYLDNLAAREEINIASAKALRIDVMQMIQSNFQQKQISTSNIFSNSRFDFLRDNSLRSISKMKKYLEYVIRTSSDFASSLSKSQSVVGRVKEYINSHLSEEITRTNMANMVYLNSDYLARLFKKETNQSLGAYLLDRRIHEAKRLLVQSNIPVNEIAQKVGYDNFSYFSHIFKEKTNMTPNEYRKQAKTRL